MIDNEKISVNYTVISYRNPILDTFTLPQFIQGTGDEVLNDLVLQTKRSCLLGQVDKRNIGLEVCHLGYFSDKDAKFDLFKEPVVLCRITNPEETTLGGNNYA